MRRHLLGLFGAVLLLAGAVLWFLPPAAPDLEYLYGSCIKAGTVLLIAWLAYPQLQQVPGWALAVLLVGIVITAAWPRAVPALLSYALLLLPVLLVIWLLRPRRTPGSSRLQR